MVRHQASRSYRFALEKLVFTLYASQLGKKHITVITEANYENWRLQKIKSDVILRVDFGHVLGNAFLQSKVVAVKTSCLAIDNCFTRLRQRELG